MSRPKVAGPSYGIELRMIDGRRDGYILPRADRAAAIREAKKLSMMSGVRVAIATVQTWEGIREVARFVSDDGETVRSLYAGVAP